MKRWVVGAAAGFFLIFLCGVLKAQHEIPPSAFFPLKEGTSWIYQGEVRWTPAGSEEVRTAQVTWKMEIVEIFRREAVTAARVKGHPQDLVWYEEGGQPGDYLIVQIGSRYYLLEGERAETALARIKDREDVLVDLVQDEELFLQAPLALHQTFGPTAQLSRTDFSYFWYVEEAEDADLSGIKGFADFVTADQAAQLRYRLVHRTRPDHTWVDIVPGVGITRFIYGHHGTVAETDVRLVEVHPSENAETP